MVAIYLSGVLGKFRLTAGRTEPLSLLPNLNAALIADGKAQNGVLHAEYLAYA